MTPPRAAASVDRIAAALLYEGYLLYPYRRSAVKNQQRFNFGVIYPEWHRRAEPGLDSCVMRTECLIQGDARARLDVTVRFLQLFTRAPAAPDEAPWQEAVEREVTVRGVLVGDLLDTGCALPFGWPAAEEPGPLLAIQGRLDLAAVEPGPEAAEAGRPVVLVRATITNLTPAPATPSLSGRDDLMLRSLVSAHTILRVDGGDFVSLSDPPAALKPLAAACHNLGTWPVLAGDDGRRDTILSSPIIVSDFPEIAPESPGDFFDGTEMDEMLLLRIMTLTDDEKREMAASDERGRRLLERTEAFGEDALMQVHGVLRQIRAFEEAP